MTKDNQDLAEGDLVWAGFQGRVVYVGKTHTEVQLDSGHTTFFNTEMFKELVTVVTKSLGHAVLPGQTWIQRSPDGTDYVFVTALNPRSNTVQFLWVGDDRVRYSEDEFLRLYSSKIELIHDAPQHDT